MRSGAFLNQAEDAALARVAGGGYSTTLTIGCVVKVR